ncbi:MAG: DNA polymerase III subunit delta [Chloroflexota bacterium]|nr:DNA polymerase III subunit delta [Dehalococcoidia bacterium]MDW8253979.1 DNA polymerase III subunit delta [Chloroflexota bacterium]
MANQLAGRVTLVFGQDDYRVAQRVRELSAPSEPALSDLNRAVIAGEKLTVPELRGHLDTLPFLSDRRVVVITGLLERFEEGDRSQRRRAEAEAFLEAFAAMPPTTFAVLVGGDLRPKRNPLVAGLAAAGATLERYFPLRPHELTAWIQARARTIGLHLSAAAARRLAALVGPNLWVLASELDKLASWAGGAPVDEEAITLLTAAAREENVFSLVTHLVAGRTREAIRDLTELLESGESPFGILIMLQNRLRHVWLVHELITAGVPVQRVKLQAGLGQLPEPVFQETVDLATRLSSSELRAMHHHLLATDEAIKTGKCEPRLALELLARTFAATS